MQQYLETILHVTDSEPYAFYRATFSPGESPVLLLHWHPEAEFFYLQEGELLFYLEQKEIHLVAGDALFIPPRLLHTAHAYSTAGGQLRALVFSTNLVVQPTDSSRYQKYVQPMLHDNQRCSLHLQSNNPAHAEILNDLKRLFHAIDVQKDTDLLAEGFIRVLWQSIYHVHPFLQYIEQQPERTSIFVQEVLSYIHEHYSENITLEQMADVLHVSKYYLCRIFRQITGVSPFTYLKKYRIMKSCELLVSTDKKISEISGLCGFNNVSYFNREFLLYTKTTPSSYRRRCRDS